MNGEEVTSFVLDGTSEIGDGQWHHVVGVFDAAALTARLYVDGELQGTSPVDGNSFTTGLQIVVGANNQGDTGFLTASVDEVAVYGRVLSASRIFQHFLARGTDVPTPGVDPPAAQVPYVVYPNPSGINRAATISFGGATTSVTQPGLPCVYSVSPLTAAIGSDGGTTRVAVSTAMGCAWTASSDAAWITVASALDGYPGHVLADGALGYWRLDETSGSIAVDSAGHGLDGTFDSEVTHGVAGAISGDTTTAFTGYLSVFNGPGIGQGPLSRNVGEVRSVLLRRWSHCMTRA